MYVKGRGGVLEAGKNNLINTHLLTTDQPAAFVTSSAVVVLSSATAWSLCDACKSASKNAFCIIGVRVRLQPSLTVSKDANLDLDCMAVRSNWLGCLLQVENSLETQVKNCETSEEPCTLRLIWTS